MDEITLYTRFLQLCIAHTHATEWLECHGFGVGYLWHMNVDSFDQTVFRKDLFYAEKWYQGGKDSTQMKLDFPFCLMLPPKIVSGSTRKGELKKEQDHSIVIYIFDLLYNDRNSHKDSVYSKRGREKVWADTATIGRQLIMEFLKLDPDATDKVIGLDDGKITEEKVFDWDSKRLAGTQLEFRAQLFATCETGEFNFEKTYPQSKSNLKC